MMLFSMSHVLCQCSVSEEFFSPIISKLLNHNGISPIAPVLSLSISCWYSSGEYFHAPYVHIISLMRVPSAILRCSMCS